MAYAHGCVVVMERCLETTQKMTTVKKLGPNIRSKMRSLHIRCPACIARIAMPLDAHKDNTLTPAASSTADAPPSPFPPGDDSSSFLLLMI